MNNSLVPVKFHDDTIFYTEKDGEMFVPMRPIIENMGLSWQPQAEKLRSGATRWGVTMIVTVAQDGKGREQICLPFRKLAGFLATINPDKVKPELHDKILLYQNECDDVLNEYWTTGEVVGKTQHNTVDAVAAARIVFEAAQLEGNQLALAMDKVYRREVGYSALEVSGTKLIAPKQEVTLTPTEIGQQLDPALSARVVNTLLNDAGYQAKVGKNWQPTTKAAGMCELLDVGKAHSDGTPIKQLKWYSSIVDIVRKLVGQKEDKQ